MAVQLIETVTGVVGAVTGGEPNPPMPWKDLKETAVNLFMVCKMWVIAKLV